jgi:hypothetical protein
MIAIRGRTLTLALSVVAAAVVATPASATSYTVVSCRDQAGNPAPAHDSSGGWAPLGTGPGRDAVDVCASTSPHLTVSIGGPFSFPVGTNVAWRFDAPPNTYLESWKVGFSGYSRPWNGQNQGNLEVWGSASGRRDRLDGAGSFGPTSSSRTGVHDAWMGIYVACDGPPGYQDCQPGQTHASATIWDSVVTLGDDSPPTAGPATGSAVASATWQGTQVFAFPATDDGGGVYQAILAVDGAPVLARTVNDWGGRCVDTTAGGRVFRYPRPCLTSVDALVAVDANQLPAGDHEVTLQVSDAAGNVRTVYAARKTIVAAAKRIGPGSDPADRGAANGENAADHARLTARWTRTRRATLTSAYGRRNVIRGRLATGSGVGIRNARVELLSAIDGRGGPPLDKGGARTRRDGRFTLILPANASSRTLVLRYRSHANETVSIAEATLRIRVKAGVRLRVDPHVAARGHTVKLSGQLLGRPLPATGKVVELQARSPGERWITFRTVRASRRGRFAARHTVRQSGPALYVVRARVREADDYPYATGVSRAVRVRVR